MSGRTAAPESLDDWQAVYAGGDSPPEQIAMCFERLEQHANLNAFLSTYPVEARAQALDSAERLRANSARRLEGIPVAVKDIFSFGGHVPTAGCKLAGIADKLPASPLIRQLLDEGCCLLGTTNMDELCYGATGLNAHYGPVRNPLNPELVTGGSSSGSAAAVSAGIVPFALGSDTGGSVRIPAALCGIVGFKPTIGLLSTTGTVGLSVTQDCIGLLTKTSSDCAFLLSVLLGRSIESVRTLDRAEQLVNGLRIGIVKPGGLETGEPLAEAFEAWMNRANQAGAQLKEVDASLIDKCNSPAASITGYEASRAYAAHIGREGTGLSPATLLRLHRGAAIGRDEYADAIRSHLESLESSVLDAFNVDIIASLTLEVSSPSIHQLQADARAEVDFTLSALRTTRPFSFLGGPAITVPLRHPSKQPVGLQLAARPYHDASLLALAQALELCGT